MDRSLRTIVLAGGLVVLAACGGGADEAATDASDERPAATGEVTVTAADFAFSPTEVTVPAGEVRLTFTNSGDSPHTFTAPDLEVDVRADPGATETVSFTIAQGSSDFRCQLHPQMTGTVAVEGSDVGAGGVEGTEEDRDTADYDY
jgi:cytochrome c oxidase subunit II